MANSSTFTFNIKAIADMKDVISNIQQIQGALSKLKMPESLKTSFNKTFGELEKETTKYQELLTKGFKTKGDVSAFTKSGNNILRLYDELASKIKSIDNSALKNMFKDLGAEQIQDLKQKFNDLQESLKNQLNGKDFASGFKNGLQEIRNKLKETNKDASELATKLQKSTFNTFAKNLSEGRLDLAENNLKSIQEQIKALGDAKPPELQKWVDDLSTAFENLKNNGDIQNTVTQLEQIKSKLTGAEAQVIQELINKFQGFQGAVSNSNEELQTFIKNGQQAASSTANLNHEVDQVKSRIQYFFGLANSINLVKRAIRSAFETVKELDAAMTETAVVTDHTISDMWQKLPEYTKRANQLGVSTLAAYKSATLYYQQGLNDQQTGELSTETLKMARIAGLEAAEATDRMTNALRGFNMELNTVDAQRVDDVYSQLAAMSASNVDEISTAMTKVASLAHSANMEFETTAAFLAQIIETTRESAETAGTALKTVVARFSEVKKLYNMDELRGTDEEGQGIDVNKVSQALRTAGIDLNRYFLGEVGLDDIFMELASKWDSLTSVQQRYIATQAAGSRQQSRFIALMQDYARTQQLVGAAYNAEGASARQFEKTQDSLQSKLARLKNAWNEFLMGITNSGVIKGVVDALTLLLNVINKLTSAFGPAASGFLKFGVAAATIWGGKKAFSDTGIATKAIGALVGNTPVGKLLGLGGGAAGEAAATPTPLIFGSGSLLSKGAKGLWGGAQKLGSSLPIRVADKAAMSASGGMAWLAGGTTQLSGVAAGLAGIGTAIAGVTAAVAAAYGIYQLWLHNSAAGKLKLAKKEAEKANKAAEEAQDEFRSLNSLQDTYKEKTEEVDNATNVQDRAAAVKERNEAILDAIKEDGTLAQYVVTERTDFGIELTVNEKALADAIKQASDAAAKAALDLSFNEASVNFAQAQIYEKQLDQYFDAATRGEGLDSQDFTYDEKYERITSTPNLLPETRAEVARIYQNLNNSYAAAAKQAELAYGNQLNQLDINSELTNNLLPLLGEAFKTTGKRIEETQLESIINTNNVSEIAKAFSGAIKSDKSLVNFNVEGNLTDILGINIESDELNASFKELETTLGLAEGTIKDTIKQNIKLQKQRQEEVTKQATMTMVQGNMTRPGSYSIDTMAKYLALEDFDDQQFVANLLGQIGNADYANLLVNPIIDAMSSGAWENSSLQQWIETIDFSNPIQGAAALNQGLASTIPTIHNLAEQILNTSGAQAQFSKSAQLSYLITSESYDDLSESLSKFIEENGKITSINIKELAESNEDLNAILKNNVTTAKGLAEILTHIEDGTIQVWDLSDAVIAATAAMDDLDGIVESTIDDLNSFDAGFDENDITGFIQKAYETINENLEKGAIGNNQNRTYLEKIFGDNIFNFGDLPVDEWGRQYEQKVSQLTSILKANQENMYSAWQGVLGTYQTESGEQLKIFEHDNEIFIEGARVTTDELINIVAKASGLGEQWARMMVSDYKNNSPDFAYQQGLNDLTEGIKIWADNLGTINGSKIYTDTDIHTLATLFNVDATAVENAIAKLGESAGELNKISFDLDKNGSISGEEYIKTFEEAGIAVRGFYDNVENGQRLVQQSIKDNAEKVINFDQLKQAFSDAGLSNAFEGVLNDCLVAGDHFVAEVGGQLRDIEIQAGESASDAYNRVTKAVADQQFAQTIGQELARVLSGAEDSQINITFLPQTEEFDKKAKEVTTKKSELGKPVTTTLNAIDNASATIQDVKKELDSIPNIKTVKLNVEETSGQGATGGVVQSYASGSENTKLQPGIALTGEEGPEIIWNKNEGYAYITGENHPEFQNLQPGDRVFNAQETKKILGGAATGGKVHSFARGYGAATKSSSKGGGGSGDNSSSKEKTPEEWRNDLDWLYNLMEDIAELERDQKDIEERYEDYLVEQGKTGKDLYKLLIQQLGNLYTQLEHQQFALEKREQEMREFMDTTNDQDQYLWYNWQDRTLEIDWDAIDQIRDEELYKHVKELIDEAEEIQGKIDDADDSIMDITNQIQKLENIWRDTFIDFENRVLKAVIKQYQTVIDNFSELNDTLNDSNTQILNSLQKQISLERQIRDNTKTEEEIANDEARLAYLRRDTSGGNELAALQLEKEVDDNRQNYEDSLVDQAISRLQEDNDAAAQQRERQIEIMQAQLDYQSENGEFNTYIRELLDSAIGDNGELLTDSELYNLLREQENWQAMSAVNKQVWEEELNNTFKEVVAFLLKENAQESGVFTQALTSAIEAVNASIGSYSQGLTKFLNESSRSSSSGSGGGSGGSGSPGGGRSGSGGTEWYWYGNDTNSAGTVEKPTGQLTNTKTLNGTTYYYYQQANGAQYIYKKQKKYATGGLNTQTGPAWLDGTPSEPEYVLNARQTDAFLKLADVLPSMMNGSSTTTSNTFGSTYVNLSVNLESVSPDYDVDRMVDLVKDKLYDSSIYRNNNVLSFLR